MKKLILEQLMSSDKVPESLIAVAKTKEGKKFLEDIAKGLKEDADDTDQWLFTQKKLLGTAQAVDLRTFQERKEKVLNNIELASKALMLAWNSEAPGLTDALSALKEHMLLSLTGDPDKYITFHSLQQNIKK